MNKMKLDTFDIQGYTQFLLAMASAVLHQV